MVTSHIRNDEGFMQSSKKTYGLHRNYKFTYKVLANLG